MSYPKISWQDYPNGFPLNSWILSRRNEYKTGKLSEDKIRRLEAIPGWTWTPLDDKWNKMYELTKRYGLIPQSQKKEGERLGYWQTRQRQHCDDPEKRKLLEKIPGWTWDVTEEKWNRMVSLSMKFGRVSSLFKTEDGLKLGQWQQLQRANQKDKSKRKELEKIPGWTWNDPKEDGWESSYKIAMKYGCVPCSFKTPDGFALGVWQNNQRKRCKDPEKRKRLEKIKNWSWSRKSLKGFASTKKGKRR